MIRRLRLIPALAACALSLVGLLGMGLASVPAQASILRYAIVSAPPGLDSQMSTANVVTIIAQHVFETLYAFDSKQVPQPMLAKSDKVSDDGMTITIELREGVPFHNGKEMTAEDVAASLERWARYGARGKTLGLASAKATGKYEVVLKLNQPNGSWRSILAFVNGGPVIYPADIAKAAGGEPIRPKDYIGTGPYKFVKWVPNRYVELQKFDKYASRSEPADGMAGARKAMIDILRFIPVPDVGTRVSGVKAGDYDYAEDISGDLYKSLKSDASVQTIISKAPIFGLMFMNSKEGILSKDFALRRAILEALNMTQALQVSVGDPALWDAQGSFFPEGSVWYTKDGTERYNQGDPKKAAEMAKAAGYHGQTIRLLVSTNYQQHFDWANVFKRQLADAGIKVKLNVTDWATLLKERADPAQWDMFITHHSPIPDPMLLTFMNDSYPGWWTSPEKEKLVSQLLATSDIKSRVATWAKLQTLAYEQVPVIKVGDIFSFDIASPKLKTQWKHVPAFPYFWGTSE